LLLGGIMANIERGLENLRGVENIFPRFQRKDIFELISSLKGSTATESEEVDEIEIIRNFLEDELQESLQNFGKSLNNLLNSLDGGRIEEREVNKLIEYWGEVKVIKKLLEKLEKEKEESL
jgi:hypothetical protein